MRGIWFHRRERRWLTALGKGYDPPGQPLLIDEQPGWRWLPMHQGHRYVVPQSSYQRRASLGSLVPFPVWDQLPFVWTKPGFGLLPFEGVQQLFEDLILAPTLCLHRL